MPDPDPPSAIATIESSNVFGGDAVILVNDGDDAERQQPVERRRGVEIAAAILEIIERHENLRGAQSFATEQFGPDLRQRDLPGRSGSLRVL
jgi:hypothetical protein